MIEQGPVDGPPVVIPGQQCYDHSQRALAISSIASFVSGKMTQRRQYALPRRAES
jgi:hypothetical protein